MPTLMIKLLPQRLYRGSLAGLNVLAYGGVVTVMAMAS